MASFELRPADVTDIPAISAIYAYHVRTGAASFELDPPSETEMHARFAALVERGYPYCRALSFIAPSS